jgi:hypothetical protein
VLASARGRFVAETGLIASLPLSLSAGPEQQFPDRPGSGTRRTWWFVVPEVSVWRSC